MNRIFRWTGGANDDILNRESKGYIQHLWFMFNSWESKLKIKPNSIILQSKKLNSYIEIE